MLYLIENPAHPRGVLPDDRALLWLEAATPEDGAAIEAIVRRHEPAAAAEHLLAWWEQGTAGLSRRPRPGGGVVGFSMLFEPDQVPYGAIEADPITRSLA